MNFDQLKEQWNKEDSDVHIPDTIKQLKESKHPIEKIQKNMKKEFPMQILAIILIAFFPLQFKFPHSQYIIYYVSYTMMVVISSYYLLGFYKFYKQTELYTGNTKNSLWKIYHELRLNMERYQSFGFLLLPHLLITIGLVIYNTMKEQGKSLPELSASHQQGLIIAVLIGTLGFITSIVLWTKYIYGGSAKQLENILNEMDE
ncbi:MULTISPECIES: hypothetical protein [Chryseobacterium]|uniref:DUF3278 domain-containing protein n=1 Tax=Chryseobacterium cucumeris TaxID=1813611 RepID=A0ABX9XBT9_9FLAO|nr:MULTISPECIES: hypothetical protein [Chryseobacterium]KYH04212.1 hypothetical protein A1704_18655 [Chryseobacterium cucumeris]MDH5036425.1 hypothetical protein [Chryseobacterium cucumeris]PWW26387.1 hypothetical protein DEU40_109138 [Chryseobacterium sp. AG844]QWT85050.1 hypothetical protein KBP46_16400 [Chryseobacterium sp. PCH239]ROH96977.1 hypothetical protein EGI15_00490 [Chryseobacterium cucumeris]